MDGIVEKEERDEGILILLLNLLGGFLKPGQHGTLTSGKVLSGIAVLADLGKYLLHDNKLIGHKREVFRKF